MARILVRGLTSLLWAGLTICAADEVAPVRVIIDSEAPAESRCFVAGQGGASLEFPVGYGRNGALQEGSEFKGGYSLLGKFRINAVLSTDRFEMTPELVASSGKTEAYLRENLFANMSSIDFDGDGEGGEYGAAFIGLEPLSDVVQPFVFESYEGVFRWYSYAIHGTQDESRVGKKITGGCINVGADDLQQLLKRVRVGDLVEIRGVDPD